MTAVMNRDNISATPAAVAYLLKMLKKESVGAGLHLSVKNSGCSGKSYVLKTFKQEENQYHQNDKVFELDSETHLKVFVDPNSLQFIKGTKIDAVKKNLTVQLVFLNPNEKSHCGCGESFYV